MSAFKKLESIDSNLQFQLVTPKYNDDKAIAQACVVGTSDSMLRLAPLNRNGVKQPIQLVSVNPMLFPLIKEIGTVVFFENGRALRFHTAAIGFPKLILRNYV